MSYLIGTMDYKLCYRKCERNLKLTAYRVVVHLSDLTYMWGQIHAVGCDHTGESVSFMVNECNGKWVSVDTNDDLCRQSGSHCSFQRSSEPSNKQTYWHTLSFCSLNSQWWIDNTQILSYRIWLLISWPNQWQNSKWWNLRDTCLVCRATYISTYAKMYVSIHVVYKISCTVCIAGDQVGVLTCHFICHCTVLCKCGYVNEVHSLSSSMVTEVKFFLSKR